MSSPTDAEHAAALAPQPLRGGTANRGRVFRIGDRVRRPRGAHTPAVHALLRHLAAAGFAGAPRVESADPAFEPDAEYLAFIPGEAATEPLADWALTEDALTSVGALLADYHRHAATFAVAGRHWQRPVPAPWQGPLATHNDLNPANVVFRAGRAVALIDFDLAAGARPAFDLAVTACFWAPLRERADIADRRRDDRVRRFRLLLDSYGAGPQLRAEVVEAVGAANRWIAQIIEDAAGQGHPAFGSLWQRDRGVHRRAATWLAGHAGELHHAVA